MKILVGVDLGSYSFNAAAKTVTITGLNALTLDQILLITNVTRQEVIYQFNNSNKGGTIAGNIVTLEYDTTAHNNADALQIWVEYEAQTQIVSGTVTVNEPVSVDDNGGSLTVDGTVAISGTVAVTQSGTWDEVGINDSGNSITVDDGGGSLTVDGSVSVAGSSTPADNFANPTTATVNQTFNMVYDGTNWDMQRGDSAGGTFVQGSAATDSPISGNPLLLGGRASDFPAAVSTDNDMVPFWLTKRGAVVLGGLSLSGDTSANNPATISTEAGTAVLLGSAEWYWDTGASAWRRKRGDTNGSFIQGPVAHDSPVGGNPVRLGGRARTSAITAVTSDNVVDWVFSNLGVPALAHKSGGADGQNNNLGSVLASSDGTHQSMLMNYPMVFNGSTWDRQRNNQNITVLSSSARTATNQSATQTNYNSRGLHLVINVTSITSTPSITVDIQGQDSVSSEWYNILTSVAITATGRTIMKVYPGIGQIANQAAADILPRTWRVNVTHANANSITYSIGASVIV